MSAYIPKLNLHTEETGTQSVAKDMHVLCAVTSYEINVLLVQAHPQ